MFPFLPTGVLERTPPLITAAVIIGMVIGAFFIAKSESERMEEERRQWKAAQSIWLDECEAMGRRIDDCTLSWSKNGMLQSVYFDKVQ